MIWQLPQLPQRDVKAGDIRRLEQLGIPIVTEKFPSVAGVFRGVS